MATITGQRLANLSTLILGTTGTLFYVESASQNSYKMSETGLYKTMYNLHLSGVFQPKNEDWRFVHRTGTESITGIKTFANTVIFSAGMGLSAQDISDVNIIADQTSDRRIDFNNGVMYGSNGLVLSWENSTLSGIWSAEGLKLVLAGNAPSSPTSIGVSGQVAMTGQKLFLCTGTNMWGYVNITAW